VILIGTSNKSLLKYAIKNVPLLTKQDKALRAREIIRDTGLRMIPVFEDESKSKIAGVVHRIDLFNISSTKSTLLVNDIMSKDFISVQEDADIADTLRQMVTAGEWYSIVENKNGEFKGILGLEGGMRYFSEEMKDELSTPIVGIYTPDPVYVYEDDEIARVWYLMLKHKYAGFPVVNKKIILKGVITQHDLLKKGYTRPVLESSSPPRKIMIKDAMTTPPLSLSYNAQLSEAVELMLKRDIGRVYIVEGGKLVGVIDREDILKFFLNMKRGR
jgi:CBS domain-containing protein